MIYAFIRLVFLFIFCVSGGIRRPENMLYHLPLNNNATSPARPMQSLMLNGFLRLFAVSGGYVTSLILFGILHKYEGFSYKLLAMFLGSAFLGGAFVHYIIDNGAYLICR